MAKNTELREKICSVFVGKNGLTSKEVIDFVCHEYEDVSQKQITNFLWNNCKNGILHRDESGKYYLTSEVKRDSVLEYKMYNNFKMEIEDICKKYMKEIENPFERFEGIELLGAQKVYTAVKKIKKIF